MRSKICFTDLDVIFKISLLISKSFDCHDFLNIDPLNMKKKISDQNLKMIVGR